MAANFWSSTQCHTWLLPPGTTLKARAEDLKYASAIDVAALCAWCLNTISDLCVRLGAQQRVIATACMYFQRFYVKNSYVTTDPIVVLVTCVYLASKVEEAPIRIRIVCAEASKMMNERGYREMPNHVPLLAEMEYCLLEELEFDLVVFHVYHLLPNLCEVCLNACKISSQHSDTKDVMASLLQMAWYIANDMYRTHLPLEHPPYVLAVACVYLALSISPTLRESLKVKFHGAFDEASPESDTIKFLASFNVSLPIVTRVIQDMLSQYQLWHTLAHPSFGSSLLTDHKTLLRRMYRMREDRCRAMQA